MLSYKVWIILYKMLGVAEQPEKIFHTNILALGDGWKWGEQEVLLVIEKLDSHGDGQEEEIEIMAQRWVKTCGYLSVRVR